MEPLQYDPRTKQQIKDTLYEFLYSPVESQFKTRLDTLIIRNTLLGGYGHKSFHYKGVLYSCDADPNPRKWNRLLSELRPQMDEYLRDVQKLNDQELPYVLGYINRVLNASKFLGDHLKLLPECVHRPLEKIIATCPCQGEELTEEMTAELLQQNKASIELIKQRMVTNLII